jgi:hypothetical protein
MSLTLLSRESWAGLAISANARQYRFLERCYYNELDCPLQLLRFAKRLAGLLPGICLGQNVVPSSLGVLFDEAPSVVADVVDDGAAQERLVVLGLGAAVRSLHLAHDTPEPLVSWMVVRQSAAAAQHVRL